MIQPLSLRASAAVLVLVAGTALAGPLDFAQPSEPDGVGGFCGCGKAHMLQQRALAGLPIQEDGLPGFSAREALTDTDMLTVDLDIEVVPATSTITGSNTMRVRSLVNGLTQFTFVLRSNFTVSSVLLNGTTSATATAPGTNSYARHVTLDRAYNIGEEFTVKVTFSGVAVSRGFGSIFFGTQNGQSLVSSLSEPYYAATWWPVKDGDVFLPGDNNDKSTGSIAVTVPDTLKVTANGTLTSVTVPASGKKKYKYTTTYPTASYLYCFSATNYNTWSINYTYPLAGGGTGTMPIEFNIYPADDTPANRAAWENCATMIATYRPIFGEYPFVNEKYGMYEFPFGGGMEHQTNTGIGGFWEDVIAHELGHQWWGDNVTCKTWNHIWLNEGFATYTECLWAERKPGSTGLPALFAAADARRPSPTTDTVYVPDSLVNNLNRIFSSNYTYNKGGWVLHQLRHVIGDTAFFQTLANYRAQFAGKGATTEDFAAVASSTSGKDLNAFFQQWVYGIGAPAYAYGWQNVTVNGQNYLKLHVRQTQNSTWGYNSHFEMPIDVRIDSASGSTTAVANNTTASTQYFLFPIAQTATNVALDEPIPGSPTSNWILTTGKTAEAYINGPAKVVAVSPTPSQSFTFAAKPTSATVTFSEPVSAAAGSFSVTGPSGSVPFSFAYSAPNQRATLTFSSPLTAGTYTITVASTVTSVAAGAQLDGEMPAGQLPSGDGLAGGSATWTFTVNAPACVADVDDGTMTGNPDGGVTIDDLLYYLFIFDLGLPAADVDDGTFTGTHDGGVTIDDLLYYLFRFDAGC